MNERYNAGSRPCVLLVDDEEEILIALGDVLEETCTVITTTSPEEGLDLLSSRSDISVVISDQRMPEMTGDRFLRLAQGRSDARAILLTGYADLDAVVAALNHGRIVAYVHKPWEADHVLSLVHEAHRTWSAQRALQTEQALLRGLLDSLSFGLAFSDAEGHCIRSNRASHLAMEIDHYPPVLRPVIERMREEVCRTGQAEELVEVNEDDGRSTWRGIVRVALNWPEGASFDQAWQVCIDRDMTQRVMMETRLNRGERLEALGRLAGGVAHDFNNLLTILSSCLDMLSELEPEGKQAQTSQKKWLNQAFGAVTRGEGLAQRLLQFGRAGKVEKTVVPLNIDLFLKERASLFQQSFYGTAPAVRCTLELPEEELPLVLVCPEQLEMALLNLCVNARDAMPKGGMVTLRATKVEHALPSPPEGCDPHHALALDVSDEGEGMSEDVQRHIFEPFFTTKEVGKGTGLGLAGIYSFVLAQHGDISVETALGEGTTMRLLLPLLSDVHPHA